MCSITLLSVITHENSNDFNVKLERENIFKPTRTNMILHENSNDHDIRLLTFATSKSICYEHDFPAPKYS
jgi:hypothetical protein